MSALFTLLVATSLATEADYAAECEEGKAASCILLSILAGKSDDAADKELADEWFGKGVAILDGGCRKRDYDACNQLGEIWLQHGNPAEATKGWERACDLDPKKCVDLADKLANRPRTPADLPVALLERACALEEGLGCVGAAILGEESGKSAEVIRTWMRKGVGLLQATCSHATDVADQARSCSALGDLNYFGIQQDADRDAGLEFWRKGCLTGEACRTQAALILAQGDRHGSIALLRRACELGDCTHWYEACSEIESEWCRPLE